MKLLSANKFHEDQTIASWMRLNESRSEPSSKVKIEVKRPPKVIFCEIGETAWGRIDPNTGLGVKHYRTIDTPRNPRLEGAYVMIC